LSFVLFATVLVKQLATGALIDRLESCRACRLHSADGSGMPAAWSASGGHDLDRLDTLRNRMGGNLSTLHCGASSANITFDRAINFDK
jgi:hypothetical protein